eukprot:CAMPEP_0175905358 /NCGR_PEP_ID=MMETSP0108-20121206/4967_1 /TAXON_ID=195067 ORGANISM="Goniomonas pacifica, Strain CCMP1869" /NCGR_SAMPLE_ID=MMETSP0108 /ASSEMBLY_ACC=CAM_ASM_000204 /LENGTH=156 /DNA_ID=CAMNT_0017227231 /DNA_START=98 /DNA_END=568 /DNA_ORIENTATION=+
MTCIVGKPESFDASRSWAGRPEVVLKIASPTDLAMWLEALRQAAVLGPTPTNPPRAIPPPEQPKLLGTREPIASPRLGNFPTLVSSPVTLAIAPGPPPLAPLSTSPTRPAAVQPSWVPDIPTKAATRVTFPVSHRLGEQLAVAQHGAQAEGPTALV